MIDYFTSKDLDETLVKNEASYLLWVGCRAGRAEFVDFFLSDERFRMEVNPAQKFGENKETALMVALHDLSSSSTSLASGVISSLDICKRLFKWTDNKTARLGRSRTSTTASLLCHHARTRAVTWPDLATPLPIASEP